MSHPKQDRDLGLTAVEVAGSRFTKYDPNIALEIVQRIASGETLTKICAKTAQPKTIHRDTFLHWVATVPELKMAYHAALEMSAVSFEEEAIDEARAISQSPGSTQKIAARNTLISQLRWSAARRNPTKYSDKGQTNIVVPVQINTTLDLGKQSSALQVEEPDIYKIKAPSPSNQDAQDVIEAEFEAVEEVVKPDFAALLRTDEPVVSIERQPIFRDRPREFKYKSGPQKKVLVPRNPNYERKK